MNTPRAIVVAVAWFALSALACPGRSSAEEDHLIAIRVKDGNAVQPSGTFTMQTANGPHTCTLKRAKFHLVPAQQNGGDDPNVGPAGEFVCYTARCSGPLTSNTTEDQFGVHALQEQRTQLVCAPIRVPVCGDNELGPGEACDGTALGTCSTFCQPDCTCGPPCAATTGGFCWYFGAAGASCDDTCAAVGGTYDPATAAYAGSGGTDANCQAVLTALGSPETFAGPGDCGGALGCVSFLAALDLRCVTPATTSAAASVNTRRACACAADVNN